jgi:hypothetical protein
MRRDRWLRLFEALFGIALGAALTAPLEFGFVAMSGRQTMAQEVIPHVCPPLGKPPGPGLDGDRISVAGKGLLVCDGSSGKWVAPEERARHVRERIIAMPWAMP